MDDKDKAKAIYLYTVLCWEVEGSRSTTVAGHFKYNTVEIPAIYEYFRSIGLYPYRDYFLSKSESLGCFKHLGIDETVFEEFVKSGEKNIYKYIHKHLDKRGGKK